MLHRTKDNALSPIVIPFFSLRPKVKRDDNSEHGQELICAHSTRTGLPGEHDR